QLGLETVLATLQILDQARMRMRGSTYGRLLAELALVRAATLEDVEELSAIVARLERAGAEAGGRGESEPLGRRGAAQTASASARGTAAASRRGKKNDEEEAVTPVAPGDAAPGYARERGAASGHRGEGDATPDYAAPGATARDQTTGAGPEAGQVIPLTPESAGRIWQAVLGQLDPMFSEHAQRAGRVAIFGPNQLVVTFPEKYNFQKAYCEQADRLAHLEAALGRVTGCPLRVRLEIERTGDADDRPPRPHNTYRQRLAESARDPLVQAAVELFEASVIRLDEVSHIEPRS
ncbi:MAG: hypothetical protein ACOC46_02885, partial [Pirellulales bacterium]